MTTIIIISVIAIILLYLFWQRRVSAKGTVITSEVQNKTAHDESKESKGEIYIDEEGSPYRVVKKIREIPRRTYIKAVLNGKYWGEIDESYSSQFEHAKFFNFSIYQVILKNAIYNKNDSFVLQEDLRVPRDKLPKRLHTILKEDGREYEVNLHEPVFADIKFDKKLHQNEGNEVFGTIDAVVTGYVVDFKTEPYFEKEYIHRHQQSSPTPVPEKPKLTKTLTPTGHVQYSGNYNRTEYFYSDYKQTYWSGWKYVKRSTATNSEGCFSSFIGALTAIIGVALLLMILPQMAILIPFFLVLFLLGLIPQKFLTWLFRIAGVLLLIGAIIILLQSVNSATSRVYIPRPVVTDKPRERKQQAEPIIDTIENKAVNDTLIKHFRIWQDYDGNQYEGVIWTRKSDFLNAKTYKNNLTPGKNTDRSYDEIIYLLKENDKNNLKGVYQLFDNIQQKRQLSRIQFAGLMVSFIQDIPYTVIVPNGCNPNLYDDKFIREYLSNNDSRCDGFEKFGINSPVEFMSTLNGDCDTRALLLYTMLSHYGYDVALLSSERYSHSLIGLNLPMSGVAYRYRNQRYVLWETTSPNTRAGILPKEISNLNCWRISLKSK